MTRDIIEVQYPALDNTESVANVLITKKTVVPANGITLKEAFSNKNNSLFIIVDTSAATATSSTMTLKKGDAYPNSMLGDLKITLTKGISAIQIQDLSRFEKADGSIDIDFPTDFSGDIYAVAKWAGVREVD